MFFFLLSIQKKFEALKDEFHNDNEELERLSAQLEVVEVTTSEANDFLDGLDAKVRQVGGSDVTVTALFDHLNVEEGSVPPVLGSAIKEADKLAEMNGDVRTMEVFEAVLQLQVGGGVNILTLLSIICVKEAAGYKILVEGVGG